MSKSLSRKDILISTILVEGGLVLLAVILAWFLGPSLWSSFSFSWDAVLWGCLGAVPPLLILLVIDRFPIGPLKHVADISDQFLRPLLRPCRWPDYFLLATLAGFCEELLFRGWLQPYLAMWMPLWASVIIGGCVFGLCHLITPTYFIIAWLISLYVAALLIWSENLLVPMIAHGVYDLIAIFVVMLSDPNRHQSQNASLINELSSASEGSHDEEIITQPTELPGSLPAAPSLSSTDKAPDSDG